MIARWIACLTVAALVGCPVPVESETELAALEFCRRRGLKLRYLVEQALIEQIEDDIDLEAYLRRKDEETIPLEQVLANRKR